MGKKTVRTMSIVSALKPKPSQALQREMIPPNASSSSVTKQQSMTKKEVCLYNAMQYNAMQYNIKHFYCAKIHDRPSVCPMCQCIAGRLGDTSNRGTADMNINIPEVKVFF